MRKKIFAVSMSLIIVISLFFGKFYCRESTTEAAAVNYQIKMPKFEKIKKKAVVDPQKYQLTDYGGYYYNQLNKNGKVMYNFILKNLCSIQKYYIGFKGATEPELAVAADAINLESVMMIDTYRYYEEDNILYVKIKVYDSKNLKRNITGKKKADKVAKKFKGSPRQIIRQAYNWCTSNIEYTENGENVRDLYGAFNKKECLCTGFSKAFAYLCNANGIKTICVANHAHMWNYVLLNGKWYLVDTTNGRVNTNTYFLKGKEAAKESIFADKLDYFKYPKLN